MASHNISMGRHAMQCPNFLSMQFVQHHNFLQYQWNFKYRVHSTHVVTYLWKKWLLNEPHKYPAKKQVVSIQYVNGFIRNYP